MRVARKGLKGCCNWSTPKDSGGAEQGLQRVEQESELCDTLGIYRGAQVVNWTVL
jgi:hypothetical protein